MVKTPLKPITSSYAIEKYYFKKLKELSRRINRSVVYWSLAQFNKSFDKNVSNNLSWELNKLLAEWESKSSDISKTLAKKVSSQIKNYVDTNYMSMGEEFKLKSLSKEDKNALSAIYQRNLNLIKSIPRDIIERYRSYLLNNVNSFNRENVYKVAKTFEGISNRRAKLIARDQTQKAVSGYTQARAQHLGFKYYEWVTAGDERVSTDHRHLQGRIYEYGKPTAVIDSYGTLGHPSERVNCRCVAVSVSLEPHQTVKKVKDPKHGDYFKIVEK